MILSGRAGHNFLYIMIFYTILVLMFLGSTLVFYRLSPYYGALGLVLVAVSGCVLCSLFGLSFVALILILIYMGGMLVVFVYSTALSRERYPAVSKLKEIILLRLFVILWAFFNFRPFTKVVLVRWSSFVGPDLLGRSNLYLNMG